MPIYITMSGIIEGLSIEQKLASELKKQGYQVYLDREVSNKYGSLCSGVDIVAIHEDKMILVQCKRKKSPSNIQESFYSWSTGNQTETE